MGQLVTNPNKEVAPEGCPNFCVAGGGAHTTSTPAGARGGRARLPLLPRSTEPFLQPLVARNPSQMPRKARTVAVSV